MATTAPPISKQSIWTATVEPPAYPALTENLHVDVCVVGAGIAGLTGAYLLAREGKRVVVIDDGPLAGGMTQMTSAHLSSTIDDRFYRIARWHGQLGCGLAHKSHAAAIDLIEEIAQREKIECEFERVDGYLFLNPGSEEKELDLELETAREAGIAAEKLVRAPIQSFDTGPALRFPRQGRIHILKYMVGLARGFEAMGGRIFSKTHATDFKDGEPCKVKAGDIEISADAVIVATNTPVIDRVAIHTKQAGYLTYVIGARVPAGYVANGLYWDTGDPYHYIRMQRLEDTDAEELLIVGGEDHKTGQADDTEQRHGRLEEWSRIRFPKMGRVEYAWAGQVMETMDGLGFIGRNPGDKHIYISTGDSGMGITHGTLGAILNRDLILGRENPWEKVYDPSRKMLREIKDYARENMNTAYQYRDWLTAGDVASEDEIPRGNGAIVRRGLKKYAVYRNEDGSLIELSATCPHLEGIVRWNPEQQTWDCPCHGSRFQKTGEVFMGPANSNLKPAKSDD